MNKRRIIIVMAIAVCLLTALACSVSPAVPKTTGKMEFIAEKTTIEQGDCVNIFWDVEGGANVQLNNEAVQLTATRYVCPDAATTYVLSADFANNTELREITIQVNKKAVPATPLQTQNQAKPSLDFWADKTTITKGECTTLHWRALGGSVWIDEKKYPAESEMEVCPEETREYYAEVGNQLVVKIIVITVQAGSSPSSGGSQPQEQPQQPAPQLPIVVKPEAPLTFTFYQPAPAFSFDFGNFSFSGTPVFPGKEATLYLNRAADVTVYIAGNAVSKKVSGDGRTITVTIPVAFTNGYIELKGDGAYAKSENLVSMWIDILLSTDLAVTDLYPTKQPIGQIFARITNRGPIAIVRSQIDLVCGAQLEVRPGGVVQSAESISKQKVYLMTIAHNETQIYDTGIVSDTDSFFYNVTCLVRPHEKYYFSEYSGFKVNADELNWPNNTYSERMP